MNNKKIKNLSNSLWPYLIIAIVMVWTFWPFFLQGKIPVAGDILLGLYYPWLDIKWDGYSTIFPVLNTTIPDSIFSFYPWKLKAVEILMQGSLPLYDPSTYMGHQLFASGTTGILYPLNFLFFLLKFNTAWGIITSLTVFLSAGFFFVWLRNKGLEKLPVLIISLAYAFSAFIGLQITFINTAHSVLWLPLILFTIDKLLGKFSIRFFLLLIFSLFSSLNAGFFQGSLYIFSVSFLYAIFFSIKQKQLKSLSIIALGFVVSIMLSAVQILPFLETVQNSNRISNYGSSGAQSEIFEFFVPFEFFITTIFPDYFGNPGKANYFGGASSQAWVGYFEFNNFSGTIVLIGSVLSLALIRKQKTVLFFSLMFLATLILTTKNPIGVLPYNLSLPVVSSLVPSRLLLVTQFSLLVMAAYGLNWVYQNKLKLKQLILLLLPLLLIYISIILITYLNYKGFTDLFSTSNSNWSVSLRNTFLPFAFFLSLSLLILLFVKFKIRAFFALVLLLSCFELVRQTSYFRPFIKPELIYPKTKTIEFLEQNLNGNRMMITKQDLIPTNSQLIYNLKIVDGEGPIYPKNHGGFIAAINSEDFGDKLPQYRRMIYFRNSGTNLLGLLNIKYVVSSDEIKNPNFNLVLEEGSTKVYENINMLPRAWSVNNSIFIDDPAQIMKTLQSDSMDVSNTAITSGFEGTADPKIYSPAEVHDFKQQNNLITFSTKSEGQALIVISEQFYPGWRMFIDENEQKPFPANYNLIGLNIPPGDHKIELRYEMQSFKTGLYISTLTLLSLLIVVVLLNAKRRLIKISN